MAEPGAPPFYSSCDLRNSGFKLAPVDTNLFPGGFNNLNPAFLPLCVQAAMSAIEKFCPDARSPAADPGEPHAQPVLPAERRADCRHPDPTGLTVPRLAEPGNRPSRRPSNYRTARTCCSNRWSAPAPALGSTGGDFDPAPSCSTTTCRPASGILQNLQEQVVLPPLHAGWAVRRKSNHFAAYDQVANDFAKIGIDPWRINPAFFGLPQHQLPRAPGRGMPGRQRRRRADIVKEKYREYGIDETPRRGQGRCRHLRHGRHDGQWTLPRSSPSTASSATR